MPHPLLRALLASENAAQNLGLRGNDQHPAGPGAPQVALRVDLHAVEATAPTVLAVAGLQVGYLMGGSILVETVFAWPGTGFLLNTAIFQRDMPLLQGTLLVLCMFFVVLNLLVDIVQPLIDPRMGRG